MMSTFNTRDKKNNMIDRYYNMTDENCNTRDKLLL
jgi:hypothetical protein